MSNQFRQHLRLGLQHKLRLLWQKQRLGKCGTDVFIDDNVRLMRFPRNIFIGNQVAMKEGSRICACNEHAKISIGDNTTIGYHCFIFASENIYIGNDCLIAPFVYIVDSNHQIKREKLISHQPNETAPIVIGNDVWLGSNVTVLKGVNIGDGAVVGAGSLINQDIEPYSIVVGTPARLIGYRK